MICRYCELIHSIDTSYSIREATRDLDSDFPRCDWHWRYVCDVCGMPRHFNAVTWCEQNGKFICIHCGNDHRLLKGDFWIWKNYYAIGCPNCDEHHPALDRLEYQGKHPWQIHAEMLSVKKGLSAEKETKAHIISNYLPQDKIISDKAVGKAWDRLADRWHSGYHEFGDINRQYIIDPAVFKILGEVKGKCVLDAGCGNGYLCRLLAKKGAVMTGVDISGQFIGIAKEIERKNPMNIKYFVGSLCNLSMFADETFNVVVSNIVLSDLQNFNHAIREIHRILQLEGQFVFSIMHPCFSSPPVHGWVRKHIDSARREDWPYWIVDHYFDRGIEEWAFSGSPSVYSFHRPLSDYMKVLINNGFIIKDFEEPIPSAKDIEEHYRELNDGDRIPFFLIIGALKQFIKVPQRHTI